MLAIFQVSEKTSQLSEDLKMWARGSTIETSRNWMIRIEMSSNPCAFVGFKI